MTSPLRSVRGAPPRTVSLRYGQLVFRFEFPDADTRFLVPPVLEEFVVAGDQPPSCRVTWRMGPLEVPSGEPTMNGGPWRWWANPDGSDTMVFFWRDDDQPYLTLRFAPDLRSADVVQDPATIGDVANLGLAPINEIIATRVLSVKGALNLHASGAVLDGRAALFMGHSGAGKTTIATVAAATGAPILSDDRTIIGFEGTTPFAWGTPWHGTGRHTSSRAAPLGGIFLLVQAPEDRVTPIPASRAYKEMFIRLIHQKLTDREVEAALGTLERLASAVPMWELRFRPAPSAIVVVSDALRGVNVR